jgi:signal transduction histidine kinase
MVSLLLQLAAGTLALRLIWSTRTSKAWALIACGIFLMAPRRAMLLVDVWSGHGLSSLDLGAESVGLVISLLLLMGIAAIGPLLYDAHRKAEEILERTRHELEQRVEARTRELGEANELLRREIVERRQAEEVVRQEHRRLRDLLDLQERDRQLMAYEIHDGLVQLLTGAMMGFQAVGPLLASDAKESERVFQQGLQTLREGIAEARRLIGGLRPPVLDEMGVIAAVEDLVHAARQRTKVEIDLHHEVAFGRLAPSLETAVFRIVQESLNNALRHSGSAKVRIALVQHGNTVGIEVEDWGRGFSLDQVPPQRFGLRGIRDRADLFSGQATIDAAPGQGTRVRVELPLVPAAEEGGQD